MALLLVVGLGAVAWTALRGGPSPRLATLEQEPILTAPVPATLLGEVTQESAWGLGFGPDVGARAISVYEVDLTPVEALDAWRAAYLDRYGPPQYDDGSALPPLVWFPDGLVISVEASDQVEDPVARDAVRSPTDGRTVVTVIVTAPA